MWGLQRHDEMRTMGWQEWALWAETPLVTIPIWGSNKEGVASFAQLNLKLPLHVVILWQILVSFCYCHISTFYIFCNFYIGFGGSIRIRIRWWWHHQHSNSPPVIFVWPFLVIVIRASLIHFKVQINEQSQMHPLW